MCDLKYSQSMGTKDEERVYLLSRRLSAFKYTLLDEELTTVCAIWGKKRYSG